MLEDSTEKIPADKVEESTTNPVEESIPAREIENELVHDRSCPAWHTYKNQK